MKEIKVVEQVFQKFCKKIALLVLYMYENLRVSFFVFIFISEILHQVKIGNVIVYDEDRSAHRQNFQIEIFSKVK